MPTDTASGLRLRCSAKPFRAAYTLAERVASDKSPHPVLKCVRLDIPEEGPPTLSATNGEGYSVTVAAEGVVESSPGTLMLSPVFGEILREVGDAVLDVEADGSKVVVCSLSDEWTLPTFDASTFPAIDPFPEDVPPIRVPAPVLVAAVKRASLAADPNSTRYAFGGCLFERGDDGQTLRIAAADGRQITAEDVPAACDGWHEGMRSVPIAPLAWLGSALGDSEEEVSIAFPGTHQAFFRFGGSSLVARLCEGRMPPYRDGIPDSSAISAPIACGVLRDGLARAALCRSEDTKSILVTLGSGELVLRGSSEPRGSSVVRIPVECPDDPTSFRVNPEYFGCLKHFPAEAAFTLAFDGERAVSLSHGNFKHVVCIIRYEKP